jgi:hypothetical protein
MPQMGSEPIITAIEWMKTHAIDGATIGRGIYV